MNSRIIGTLTLSVLMSAGVARAALIGVNGNGIIMDANTETTGATADFFNNRGDDLLIRAWNELQNVRLTSDITVDFSAPGIYESGYEKKNPVIDAGTIVSSHLIVFDPEQGRQRRATFEFDYRIIAVIIESDLKSGDRFLATDFLGHPDTEYPGVHFDDRGLEFGLELVEIRGGRLSCMSN